MFEKDAILSKISIIRNCLSTIRKVTNCKPESLDEIITQDVFVLNLQRSVQACIDISNIIISTKGLKIPAKYKQSFDILRENNIIEMTLAEKIKKMIGFRNIAVHDYKQLDINILKSILIDNISDFEDFIKVIYKYINLDKDFEI
ncbi:MAG: DUF86 domain-containing protein [Candidatus Woesearchaeota archaeon]